MLSYPIKINWVGPVKSTYEAVLLQKKESIVRIRKRRLDVKNLRA